MSGRVDFTERDSDYLVQYIAKYNPQVSGRSGNNLYQRLCDEDNRRLWPFAKRHSWQSWRNYYVKNREYMDPKIERLIKSNSNEGRPSAPPPSSQNARGQDKAPRVFFTEEDNMHLVDFLSSVSPSEGAMKGQKLWESLVENLEQYPWASRHSWQSWRERYTKNAAYYNREVRKALLGDAWQSDEPAAAKPKTVEDKKFGKRPLADAPADASSSRSNQQQAVAKPSAPEKRKRASNAHVEQPTKKKARMQPDIRHPDRSRSTRVDETRDASDDEANVDEAGSTQEEDGKQASNSSPGEEEDLGSPGSDDYHGENFGSPGILRPATTDARTRTAGTESGSSEPEEEVYHLLTDPPHADIDDDHEMDMDIDKDDDTAGNRVPILSRTPPPGASPPVRKQNARIRRYPNVNPGTPRVSPTEEADARHRREHSHTPEPERKHATRIRRVRDENFFGTPEVESVSTTNSALTTKENSPTARHVAHLREHQHGTDDEEEPAKPRQPPRLDEGPWSKALSDAQGRARVQPAGSSRRRSGVNFEDEVEVIGTQDTPGEGGGEDAGGDSDAVPTPVQWPPVRHKARVAAPSTPSGTRNARGKGKARENATPSKMVTTEVVSVKTVRTVKRRVPRASNGTPYVRDAPPASDDVEESPSQPHRESNYATEPEPSQHHDFSQPIPALKLTSSLSNSSSATTGSTVPLPRPDVLHLQKLLQNAATGHEESPSKAARDAKQPMLTRLYHPLERRPPPDAAPMMSHQDKSQLDTPRGHASISRATISPPGVEHDENNEERFDMFAEKEEPLPLLNVPALQSSPLANKGESRGGPRRVFNEIWLEPSTSTQEQSIPPPLRMDKGKARADRLPSGSNHAQGHMRRNTVGGYASRDPFYAEDEYNHVAAPARRLPQRQSLPVGRYVGSDDYDVYHSALDDLFRRTRSGSAHSRSYTLDHGALDRSSRSISPTTGNIEGSLANTLPPDELHFVKGLGMQTAFLVMARNHGFSEETVLRVYEETGSLRAADHVLRVMRESANEGGNEALQSLADAVDRDEDDDENENDYPQYEEGVPVTGPKIKRKGANEEEVEDVLEDDSWLLDHVPLAESSRVVSSTTNHRRTSSSSQLNPRKRHQLHITRVSPEREVDAEEYSPPKHTRAAKVVRKARKSVDHSATLVDTSGEGADAMDLDASRDVCGSTMTAAKTAKTSNVRFGSLARYNSNEWRHLSATEAKIATGKSLASLLK